MKKDAVVIMRVSEDKKAKWQKKADEIGVSLTALIVFSVENSIKEETKEETSEK